MGAGKATTARRASAGSVQAAVARAAGAARPGAAGDRTLAAAAAILVYSAIIGFTDNHVRSVADEIGLWQFHALRSLVALGLLGMAAPVFGLGLRPRRPRGVAARSLVHGLAMLFYFGCLAVLPVPVVAAGLFSAPIFVLVLSRFAFGEPVGAFRLVAVAAGFLGTLLVLDPGAGVPASPLLLAPVAGGFFYALGNIATRRWCAGESAWTLTAGFFAALGLLGLLGMAALAIWPVPVPEGTAGFVRRGAVLPSAGAFGWVAVQAAGALVAIALLVRGYQLTDAGRAAVFEYVLLPIAAGWSWLIWGDTIGGRAWAGIALIVAAGLLIALPGRGARGAPGGGGR